MLPTITGARFRQRPTLGGERARSLAVHEGKEKEVMQLRARPSSHEEEQGMVVESKCCGSG